MRERQKGREGLKEELHFLKDVADAEKERNVKYNGMMDERGKIQERRRTKIQENFHPFWAQNARIPRHGNSNLQQRAVYFHE